MRTGCECQRLNRFVDQVGVVSVALFRQQQWLQSVGIQIPDLRLNLHIAKMVQIAFVHGEGDVEVPAIGREFCDRRYNPEIGITARKIKPAELFAIERETVGVIIVIGAEPSCFSLMFLIFITEYYVHRTHM